MGPQPRGCFFLRLVGSFSKQLPRPHVVRVVPERDTVAARFGTFSASHCDWSGKNYAKSPIGSPASHPGPGPGLPLPFFTFAFVAPTRGLCSAVCSRLRCSALLAPPPA